MSQDDVDGYKNSGKQNLNKGNYDQAIAYFTQALSLNPNDAELYFNRSAAYSALGVVRKDNSLLDQAINDIEHTLKLNPDFAAAYTARASAYFNRKEYDKAIEDFNHAIQLNSNDFYAYSGRGCIYVVKGEYDRGIKDMETSLRINPNHPDARIQIEYARMMQKAVKK